ncbi:MAG: hypothetical protein HRT72_00930 [Flavobacteriales bacterium]|nr:hypothetical protein [Flavobacteriales bacterium]
MADSDNMKDAFENFEMDPIDSGWDNLREKMMNEGIESRKEEKDRKGFFYILASILLLGLGFLFFSDSSSDKEEKQAISDSVVESNTTLAPEEEPSTPSIEMESESIKESTSTEISSDVIPTAPITIDPPVESAGELILNNEGGQDSVIATAIENVYKPYVGEDYKNNEDVKLKMGKLKEGKDRVSENEEKPEDQIQSKDYVDTKMKVKEDKPPKEKVARSWAFSPFFCADLAGNSVSTERDLNEYTKLNNSASTKDVFTYTTGINVGVVLSEKVILQSGVWLTQKKPVIATIELKDSDDNFVGTIDYYYNGRYMDIPLRVKVYRENTKYYSPNENFNFFYTAGVVFNKVLRTSEPNYYEEDIEGAGFREVIQFERVGLSLTASGGVERSFNSHFSVFAEILAKKGLTNVLSSDSGTPYQHHKTKSYGAALGVRLSF